MAEKQFTLLMEPSARPPTLGGEGSKGLAKAKATQLYERGACPQNLLSTYDTHVCLRNRTIVPSPAIIDRRPVKHGGATKLDAGLARPLLSPQADICTPVIHKRHRHIRSHMIMKYRHS
jgi:hypothetical protein